MLHSLKMRLASLGEELENDRAGLPGGATLGRAMLAPLAKGFAAWSC